MIAPIQPAEFRAILDATVWVAQRARRSHVDVTAGNLHRDVGGYPGPHHQLPICCKVMKEAMRAGDLIVSAPANGTGASLTIRYLLPR